MNLKLLKIPKTLAILAMILLPVVQSWAMPCCCSTANDSQSICCEHDQPHSDSMPCQCPIGCCGKIVSDLVINKTITNDELIVAVVLTTSLDTVDDKPTSSLTSTVSHTSASGLQRCALLCCYRL